MKYIHTYILIYIAPKIVKTNLRRWTNDSVTGDAVTVSLWVRV